MGISVNAGPTATNAAILNKAFVTCNRTLHILNFMWKCNIYKQTNEYILQIQLTCWSQSGHDLVAIFTFFVLFADIVESL